MQHVYLYTGMSVCVCVGYLFSCINTNTRQTEEGGMGMGAEEYKNESANVVVVYHVCVESLKNKII